MTLTDHELTAARIIRETWLIDFRPDTLRVTPQGRAYEAIVRALGEATATGEQLGAGDATGSPGGPERDLETIRDANDWIIGALSHFDEICQICGGSAEPFAEAWKLIHRLDQLLGCDCQAPYAEPGPQLVSNSCPVHNRLRAAEQVNRRRPMNKPAERREP